MHTIQIDGETITLTVTEQPGRTLPTCTIVATHAEGGRAEFEIVRHQCEFIVRSLSAETPSEVYEAVRGICRRAGSWYGKRPSMERVSMERAILENQAVQ